MSPKEPRDALCQLRSWPTVVRIMQTHRRAAILATVTFYSCIVLYMHHSNIAQPAWVSSTYSHATNLVDVNWTVVVSPWSLDSITTTVVDDIAYSSASAPSLDADDRADRHKLLAVRRMSGGVRHFERQFQVDGTSPAIDLWTLG